MSGETTRTREIVNWLVDAGFPFDWCSVHPRQLPGGHVMAGFYLRIGRFLGTEGVDSGASIKCARRAVNSTGAAHNRRVIRVQACAAKHSRAGGAL